MTTKPDLTTHTQTQIDLGDDLLQTRTLIRPSKEELAPAAPVEGPDELVINAKILVGEGLLEEAKGVLRKALLAEPSHGGAIEKLADIQKLELKQILSHEAPRARRSYRPKGKSADENFDPETVLKELEHDLGESPVPDGPFETEAGKAAFIAHLESQCQDATPQDRLDLGIAFLEMEVYSIAIDQFQVAARSPAYERRAIALGAYAKILANRAFDALLDLDPLVADASIEPRDKVDYGYLVGRAYETLGRYDQAAVWYRGVLQIESQYRDSQERLKKCERILSSSSR